MFNCHRASCFPIPVVYKAAVSLGLLTTLIFLGATAKRFKTPLDVGIVLVSILLVITLCDESVQTLNNQPLATLLM